MSEETSPEPRCVDCGAQQVTLDNHGRCVECFIAHGGESLEDQQDIVLPKLPSMPEDDLITVQWSLTLPRDIVAFIEREAYRRMDERKRAAPDSTDIMTVESLASQFLHGGALLAFLELSENMSEDDMARYFPPVPQDADD